MKFKLRRRTPGTFKFLLQTFIQPTLVGELDFVAGYFDAEAGFLSFAGVVIRLNPQE